MTNLNEAFEIPLNCENLAFAQHPYQPIRVIGQIYDGSEPIVDAREMMTARCFDIRCGAQCSLSRTSYTHGLPQWGWSTSPGVYTQLYSKGPMDMYLTGMPPYRDWGYSPWTYPPWTEHPPGSWQNFRWGSPRWPLIRADNPMEPIPENVYPL